MNLNFIITKQGIQDLKDWFNARKIDRWILCIATLCAIGASLYSYLHGYVVIYGDAESHLNIAKRVIDSLTPGFAQLGGIWLPLPHLLLVPFVYSDFLWRTGLAGSIVSGICFVISSLYLYKSVFIITKNKLASFFGALIFITNPNMLYMQSTAMTELTLIVFFVLSTYYFILFLQDDTKIVNLLAAAFFGFCASLSRYDGWALVLMEGGVLFLYYFPYWDTIRNSKYILGWNNWWNKKTTVTKDLDTLEESQKRSWHILEGKLVIFCTLALFGIVLWLGWDWLILGDPLYFSHSSFSAASQQQIWLGAGELPSYHNIWSSFLYYFVTTMSSVGVILFLITLVGFVYFLFDKKEKIRYYIMLVFLVPFFFNVITLFLGQSVIFIPSLTPTTFDWTLFNVRYGLLMVPFAAFCIGYLFYKSKISGKLVITGLFLSQFVLYGVGYSKVIVLQDGQTGLSSETVNIPDAQGWLNSNYDYGFVLVDDFGRTISILRTPIKMQNVIYVGNKPYWQDSLDAPQTYARWIIIKGGDSLWINLWEHPGQKSLLLEYFDQVYSGQNIMIFKRKSGM